MFSENTSTAVGIIQIENLSNNSFKQSRLYHFKGMLTQSITLPQTLFSGEVDSFAVEEDSNRNGIKGYSFWDMPTENLLYVNWEIATETHRQRNFLRIGMANPNTPFSFTDRGSSYVTGSSLDGVLQCCDIGYCVQATITYGNHALVLVEVYPRNATNASPQATFYKNQTELNSILNVAYFCSPY